MTAAKFISLVTMLLLLAGCDWVEKRYTYQRDQREPRGTFTVSVKIDPRQNLVMLEDYEPVKGNKSSSIRDYFRHCQYFDDANWKCDGAPGQERVEMLHGKLTHYYWTEVRDYSSSYRLAILK